MTLHSVGLASQIRTRRYMHPNRVQQEKTLWYVGHTNVCHKRGRQPDMVENHKISTSICSLTYNTCTVKKEDLVIKAKLLHVVKYEQQKLVSAPFSSACFFISGSQTIGMIVWLPDVHKFGSQIICGIQNIKSLQ